MLLHRVWRQCCVFFLALIASSMYRIVPVVGLPCAFLPENPTWGDLIETLNAPGDFASLCPFTIRGDQACPSPNNGAKYNVTQNDLLLVCDLTAGLGDECIIDCPSTQFNVQGGFTAQSITFRGSSTTPVIVGEYKCSCTVHLPIVVAHTMLPLYHNLTHTHMPS